MQLDWSLILAALGLAFVFEGMVYFLGANRLPDMLRMLASRPPSELRLLGLAAMITGLVLVYLARL